MNRFLRIVGYSMYALPVLAVLTVLSISVGITVWYILVASAALIGSFALVIAYCTLAEYLMKRGKQP